MAAGAKRDWLRKAPASEPRCSRRSRSFSSRRALLRKAFQSAMIANKGATFTRRPSRPQILGHQLQIGHIVAVVEKRLLPAIASLGNVVRQTRNTNRANLAMLADHQSSHNSSIIEYCVPGIPVVPGIPPEFGRNSEFVPGISPQKHNTPPSPLSFRRQAGALQCTLN